jgi:hypothetical protein
VPHAFSVKPARAGDGNYSCERVVATAGRKLLVRVSFRDREAETTRTSRVVGSKGENLSNGPPVFWLMAETSRTSLMYSGGVTFAVLAAGHVVCGPVLHFSRVLVGSGPWPR